MTAFLRMAGGSPERIWSLDEGANLLGRNPRGEGRSVAISGEDIPNVLGISRLHVSIDVSGNRLKLRRFEATSAVSVNGRTVGERGEVELRGGDRLVLGSTVFDVCVASDPVPSPASLMDTRFDGAGDLQGLARRNQRLENALAAAQSILTEESFESALERTLREVVKAFGFDCGVVADWDPAAGRLRGRAFVGLERIEDVSNVSQSIIRRALDSGQPFMTQDALRDERISTDQGGSVVRYEIRQALCAPLLSGRNNLGVIYVDRRTEGQGTPLTPDDEQILARLAQIVAGALASIRDRQAAELRGLLDRAQIVGRSEVMLRLAARIRGIARALDRNPRVPVLIQGPQGAGKELVARAIRMELARGEKPYLSLNMGGFAANPELAHSALFGHRKGAYSHAFEDRPGALGVVDRGVLFLDEVGDMPRNVQRLLKEFLAEETYGTYSRLGEEERKRLADVVVLMATNKDLEALVRKGEFEDDVRRRLLSGHVIQVPPLREHREDIPEIVSHYLCLFNERYARHLSISSEGMRLLQEEPWEYNVSGLRSVVHALVSQMDDPQPLMVGRDPVERILCGQGVLPSGGGPGGHDTPCRATPAGMALWEMELEHCLGVWEAAGRNYRRACEKLEIAENTLRKKLLEGQIRRSDGDLARVAAFFRKTEGELAEEMATYRIQRGR